MLEVEDVNGASCAVDYMKKMEAGQREWRGGEGEEGFRVCLACGSPETYHTIGNQSKNSGTERALKTHSAAKRTVHDVAGSSHAQT
jgi:hypothetical protein